MMRTTNRITFGPTKRPIKAKKDTSSCASDRMQPRPKQYYAPLWPLKVHYFLVGAGLAPVIPFLPVIGKQMGIPGQGVGFILALVQIFGLIVKPLFGGLMDKYPHRKKLMLQAMVIIGIILFTCLRNSSSIEIEEKTLNVTQCNPVMKLELQTAPDPCLKHKLHSIYSSEQDCELVCDQSSSFISHFSGLSATVVEEKMSLSLSTGHPGCVLEDKCLIRCNEEDLNRVLNAESSKDIFYSANFWFILYIWVTAATAFGGVGTFQDAIASQCVINHPSGETFGHQRLWASIGWGSSALLVGYLVDVASAEKLLYDYTPAFGIMTVLLILDVLAIYKLPVPHHHGEASTNPYKDVGKILLSIKVWVFLVYATCIGIFFGALSQTFILLEELGHRSDCNGIQAMKFLQGLVLAINCTAETPVFLYSGRIIKKFGTVKVMHFILFVFTMRMFFYGMMTSPWQVVFIEFTNGLTCGLFYPTVNYIAIQISPENLRTTTTSVAYFMEGLGMAIGAWMAGSVTQSFSASSSFMSFGWFGSVAFVIHYAMQNLIQSNNSSL